MTNRFTIKTTAYARNRHYLEIAGDLAAKGYKFTPNVAIDGEVSIDTTAPRDVCLRLVEGRPRTVTLVLRD